MTRVIWNSTHCRTPYLQTDAKFSWNSIISFLRKYIRKIPTAKSGQNKVVSVYMLWVFFSHRRTSEFWRSHQIKHRFPQNIRNALRPSLLVGPYGHVQRIDVNNVTRRVVDSMVPGTRRRTCPKQEDTQSHKGIGRLKISATLFDEPRRSILDCPQQHY